MKSEKYLIAWTIVHESYRTLKFLPQILVAFKKDFYTDFKTQTTFLTFLFLPA
jgi:hypothetical protein